MKSYPGHGPLQEEPEGYCGFIGSPETAAAQPPETQIFPGK